MEPKGDPLVRPVALGAVLLGVGVAGWIWAAIEPSENGRLGLLLTITAGVPGLVLVVRGGRARPPSHGRSRKPAQVRTEQPSPGGNEQPRSEGPHGGERSTTRRATVLRGGLSAVLMLFPVAGLCALVYRFPVPFVGYERGFAAVPSAVLAVLFYGLLGGFPAAFALGAAGGVAAYRFGSADPRRIRDLTLWLAGLVACLIVVFLAILDKLIGPW